MIPKRKVISGPLTPKRMREIIHEDALKEVARKNRMRQKKAKELKKNDPAQSEFKF